MDLIKDTIRSLEHIYTNESSGNYHSTIEVKGTSYNANDTGSGYIKWNEYRSTIVNETAVSSRGLTLAIWNHDSMELLDVRGFDVYANDAARIELANRLDAIHAKAYGNVIYALASFDAISTNDNLANAMETARAFHWFNLPGLATGPTHRHPYAAIGTSDLGIIKEVLHSNASGADAAIIKVSIPKEWVRIGSEGYGPDLALGQQLAEVSETTAYGFAHGPHLTVANTGWRHIKEGEWVKMTGQRKVDVERFEAGGTCYSYFWGASNSNGWINSSQSGTRSIEWEHFELAFKWSTSSGQQYLRWGHYHMPSNNKVGTSYKKNVTIQKCGFENPYELPASPEFNKHSAQANSIIESPGFSMMNPDTYYAAWLSDQNLTGRPNLSDSRHGSGFDTNTVKWFNRELTGRNEYSIHEGKNFTGDSNRYSDVGYVNIDPSKTYMACIWQYCDQKTSGNNYVGTHTRNASSTTVPTYRAYDGYGTTNPYSHYPGAGSIEKKKWSLFVCWFLPHTTTDAEGLDFHDKYWSNYFGNYENASSNNNSRSAGDRWSNGGNVRVARFKSTDAQIHLRWLDYYNGSGQNHKTWWALPGIFEVDPLKITSGTIFTPNLKEI